MQVTVINKLNCQLTDSHNTIKQELQVNIQPHAHSTHNSDIALN